MDRSIAKTSGIFEAPRSTRVLLAEDDVGLRGVVKAYLDRKGFEVFEAGDGVEVLEVLARQPVDIILMDIDMPRLNGIDTCRRVREQTATGQVPILFITGRDDESRHVGAFTAGGDDFIAKPFAWPILLARIANLVRRSQAEQDVHRLLLVMQRHVNLPVRSGLICSDAETLFGTILFTDLRDYTAVSAREDAKTVFDSLSVIQEKQTSVVTRFGGYVDKFSGDGMLAVFLNEGHAAQACRAAAGIVEWARAHSIAAFWPAPPLGFGLHTGSFLRGELGGKDYLEFTVIGETVNIASRLCGIADALEVVASQAVRDHGGPDLEWTRPRTLQVKGLPNEIAVCSLRVPDGD